MSSSKGVILRLSFALALVACAGALVPMASTAATPARAYSAAGQFSVVRNPNGPWSYSTNRSLLAYVDKTCAARGLICRWNGKPVCNSAIVAGSRRGMPTSFLTIRLPGDHLDLDPESNPNVRTRFTAPMAGMYVVQGDFLAVDVSENSHAVSVLVNGKSAYANTIARFGQRDSFNLTRKLNRGDTLDFVVSTGSACTYLGTGLKAVITAH
jgi:hypothetical protein